MYPPKLVTTDKVGKAGRLPALQLVACLLAGCSSYNSRTAGALDAFRDGRFDQSMKSFADVNVTDSTFLSGAEAGMVALTAGEFEEALEHFTQAADFVREYEQKGLLDPESLSLSLIHI